MNILFICRHNRFRSRIAECYFKEINRNQLIHVKSAGIIRGTYPLDYNQVKIAKQLGVNLQGKPAGMTSELLKWQNMIVIVADDVPQSIFAKNNEYGKKLLVWKIKDAHGNDDKDVKRAITQIKKKVENLAKELE